MFTEFFVQSVWVFVIYVEFKKKYGMENKNIERKYWWRIEIFQFSDTWAAPVWQTMSFFCRIKLSHAYKILYEIKVFIHTRLIQKQKKMENDTKRKICVENNFFSSDNIKLIHRCVNKILFLFFWNRPECDIA